MADILSAPVLRMLLLVVLFSPLAFAVLVALMRDNYKAARQAASLCAGVHMGVTVVLLVAAGTYLTSQGGHSSTAAATEFQPVAVPGDPGAKALVEGGSQEHSTTWDIFYVARARDGAPRPAVQFFIGVDGLNIWLLALTSLMTYLAVLMSYRFATEKAGGYYAWLFVLQTAVTGAFVSFDVILFYVFFELTLIPAFFLIGGWGVGGNKRDAARKFFLYTLLGSLFSLVGLVGIVYTNPTPDVRPGGQAHVLPAAGPVSFSVNQLMKNVSRWEALHEASVNGWKQRAADASKALAEAKGRPDPLLENKATEAESELAKAVARRTERHAAQWWLFFALVAGFVVKIPLVPFHTWLPAAYGEAPPAVTMILSAVMAKLGTLGLLRIVIPLCPDMAVRYGLPVFGTLAAVGIVYAALCAYAQKDIKLLAAYSSVSHLGLLVLGTFALNSEGMTGAVLHMLNHGLTAGGMFALVAFLYDRYRTTDMTQFGGLMGKYPGYAFWTVVICLASVGLPGLNNFVSEMLLLAGLFTPWNTAGGYALAVAGAAGIFLSAWYTFTMLRTAFFGPERLPVAVVSQTATSRELFTFGLIGTLCLALGLYPKIVIDTVRNDVAVIEKKLEEARGRVNKDLGEEEKALPPRQHSSPADAQPWIPVRMPAIPPPPGGLQKQKQGSPKAGLLKQGVSDK